MWTLRSTRELKNYTPKTEINLAASQLAAHRWRAKRFSPFPFQPQLDHVRAPLVIPIEFLTMHAVDAFVDVDMPFRVDRLDRALIGAALARPSTLRPTLQPFEHSHT